MDGVPKNDPLSMAMTPTLEPIIAVQGVPKAQKAAQSLRAPHAAETVPFATVFTDADAGRISPFAKCLLLSREIVPKLQ